MQGYGQPKWGITHDVGDGGRDWVFGDACGFFCFGLLAIGKIGQRIKKQIQMISSWLRFDIPPMGRG